MMNDKFLNRTQPELEKPLTNLQLEILELCEKDLNDQELLEVKDLIAKFLMRRARRLATQICDEKGYTEKTFKHWVAGITTP